MQTVIKYILLGCVSFCILWLLKQLRLPIFYSNDHLLIWGFDPDIVRKCCSDGWIYLQNLTMVEFLFYSIVLLLYGIGYIFDLTYNEVNILLYYWVIPYSWLWMLDRYFEIRYLRFGGAALYFAAWIWIISTQDFTLFCDNLFKDSVIFLHAFASLWDYWEASVYVCLMLPVAIYIGLWELLRRKRIKNQP